MSGSGRREAEIVRLCPVSYSTPAVRELVFLAVIQDTFSRRVIGWALDRRMEDELALTAPRMAIKQRGFQPGPVHHSDRGSQYARNNNTELLKANGFGSA